LPKNILQIQLGATLDQKPDDHDMASQGGLMQGCGVRMESDWVVPVWIFARIEQSPDDLNMTKLRRHGERAMTVFAAGGRKQPTEIRDASKSCSDRQIDLSTALDEGVRCLKLAMRDCRLDSGVWVRSVIAKEIDQWELYMTFARYASRRDEAKRFVDRGLVWASVDYHLGYLDNVERQSASANWIFRSKFQQRWIPKIVSAFEFDMLMHQIWMFLKVSAQVWDISLIEKIHGTTKGGVFNSFVVR
jgi:hypothetical protein